MTKINETLTKQVLPNDIAKKVFESILEILCYIKPIYISRQEFDKKSGNFLEQTGKEKFGGEYNLYLPKDLNNKDIYLIIFLLNEKFDLGLDIKKFIGYIKLGLNGISEEEVKNLKKEIQNKIDKIISVNGLKPSSYNKYQEMIDDKSKFSLRNTIKEIKEYTGDRKHNPKKIREIITEDNDLITNLYKQEFDLSFFRNGRDLLRYGLKTLTLLEFQKIKEEIDTGDVIEKDLDDMEQKLRDKMKIDEYKNKLEEARNSGNKQEIERLELEASNLILKTLNTQYPYQYTKERYGFQPTKILESKQMYCIGFSLVGHAFLNELGIKHNGLNHINHSTLEVIIGGKSYYFDATKLFQLENLKWSNEVTFDGKTRIYREFELPNITIKDKNGKEDTYKDIAYSGDPEKILLSQIYNNKGIVLNDLGVKSTDEEEKLNYFNQALDYYNQALKINPKYSETYNNKGNVLNDLGLKSSDKKEKLNYFNQALNCYNQALEINPKNSKVYNNKGNVLNNLGLESTEEEEKLDYFKQALDCYNQALEINPKYLNAYLNKGIVLDDLGMKKLSKLYKFAYYLLNKKAIPEGIDTNLEEIQIIKKLYKEQNFDGIRDYLLNLEK